MSRQNASLDAAHTHIFLVARLVALLIGSRISHIPWHQGRIGAAQKKMKQTEDMLELARMSITRITMELFDKDTNFLLQILSHLPNPQTKVAAEATFEVATRSRNR